MKFVTHIRPAESRDADYLVDIDIKSFDAPWLNEDWSIVWDDNDSSIHVATVNGTPVGFAVTERQTHNGKTLNHIYKIAVRGQFRYNGVSRMLMATIYDEALRCGVDWLSISIPGSMTIEKHPRCCIKWLDKMQFKAVETLDDQIEIWGQSEEIILFMMEVKK